MMEQVKFTQMKDGTAEEYQFLTKLEVNHANAVGERLLDGLQQLDGSFDGYQITRLGHSLQSGTRAWWDGADIDWVVSSLLHDIGDHYAPYNHDEFAASILQPYVREQCTWTVKVHADFQKVYYADKIGGNPNARDRHKGNQYFDDCVEFCELWDQASFDPDYDTLPIEFFRPLVLEVFSRKINDPDILQPGVRLPLTNPDVARERREQAA